MNTADSTEIAQCKNVKRSYQCNINLFHHLNDQTKNLEDCVIVWLDLQLCAKPDHIDKLRSVVNYLKLFDDTDACMKYITAVKQEQIFFIISGRTGKHIIPLIHNTSQLNSIYIFCIKDQSHKKWSSKYSKVKGVFIDEQTLYDRLSKDVLLCSSQTPISIIKYEHTSHALNKDEKPLFLWSQILLQVMLRLPSSRSGKQDMINHARDQYSNNLVEQQKIDEFERNYSPDNAIKWYTRDCFVYRLVNKALRTENIDNIFIYRFFIADLYRQLERLYLSYLSGNNSSTITCYRGQVILINEFERIKSGINQYISINTFFSTSKSSSVAVNFFMDAGQQSDVVCVLFEILINVNIQTKPFAFIHDWSVNSDENEILFTMGTIFKIESCDEFDSFWHVTLTLSTEPDQEFKKLLKHYEINIGETSSLLLLGEFLHKINELDRAERYYHLLIEELSADHVDVGMAFNNIGTIYTDRGKYQKAKFYLEKAFEIFQKTSSTDDLNMAEIYLNLATVYSHMEKTKTALKFERKALQIQLKALPENHLTLATTYNNMANSYDSLNKKPTALKYYHKTLKSERQNLPSNHPDLAVTYNNMASTYIDMHDYQHAYKYVNKALDIRQQSLPSWHPDLADTYRLIGTLSVETDDITDALEKYHESLRILLSTPTQVVDHHRIYQVYTDIGDLHFSRQLYKSALKSFKLSLDHLKQCEFDNPYDKSIAYNNIAAIFVDLEQYDKAKTYCRKSLRFQRHCQNADKLGNKFNSQWIMAKIFHAQKSSAKALIMLKRLLYQQHRLLPDSCNKLCLVYTTIKHIYFDKRNYKKSEKCIKKSIKYRTKFMPGRKIDMGSDYEALGIISMERSLPKQAIKWLKKGINTYLCAKPTPAIHLANSYFSLGKTFVTLEKYSRAKFYLIKARNLLQQGLSPYDVQLIEINVELGNLEYSRYKFEMATKYFQFALNIYEQRPTGVPDLISLHRLLGMSLSAEQKYVQAMSHCQKVLDIAKEHESILCEETEQIHMIVTQAYENIIVIYLVDNKLDEAMKNARACFKISRQYPMNYFISSKSLLLMGAVHRHKKLYQRSLTFLRKARRLINKCSYKDQTKLLPHIYAELGICYGNMDNCRYHTAYKYYNLAKNTSLYSRDESFRRDIEENIKHLENKYEDSLIK